MQTAKEMAEDLRRYLDDRPILARPPTLTNRLMKWSRRHLGIVWTILLTSSILAVCFGVSAALIAASRNQANTLRIQAEAERNRSNQLLYLAQMQQASHDWNHGQVNGMHEMLQRHVPLAGRPDYRGWEWYYYLGICHGEIGSIPHSSKSVRAVAWNSLGSRLATASLDGHLRIWDAATYQLLATVGVRERSWHRSDGMVAGRPFDCHHGSRQRRQHLEREFAGQTGQQFLHKRLGLGPLLEPR